MAGRNEDGAEENREGAGAGGKRQAFVKGFLSILSTPSLVLLMSFIGFGALARQIGLTAAEALFTTASIFALPGQVVLADQITQGAGIFAAAFAVTLTAIRLMPLTASLLPYLRDDKTPKWIYFPLSHFVAVTVWVESMRHLPHLATQLRVPRYLGFGCAFFTIALTGTIAGYFAAGAVPLILRAALLFLTPIYFFLSLLIVSAGTADAAAILIGTALGPIFYMLFPGFDLLLTGLIGGTLAYGGARWVLPRT